MSFIEIEDHDKREEMVHDYERIISKLRERGELKKSSNVHQARTLEKTFAPIIKSQKNMTEEIVNTLKAERKRVKFEEKEFGPLAEDYRRRYTMRDPDIDTQFGINFLKDGQTVIGNTPITIEDNDDIVINGHVYAGTEGLWTLLTERKKDNLHSYNDNAGDLRSYMDILRDTHVLHKNFDPNSTHPRSNSSWKWRKIFSPIWEKIQEEDDDDDDDADADDDEGKKEEDGGDEEDG